MIEWTDEQLEEAGIDKADLEILLNHLSRVKAKLEKMNMNLYCTMDIVHVMHNDYPPFTGRGEAHRENVVASVSMRASGGDW